MDNIENKILLNENKNDALTQHLKYIVNKYFQRKDKKTAENKITYERRRLNRIECQKCGCLVDKYCLEKHQKTKKCQNHAK